VHRRQITFDWVDRATGQAQRGQITPATAEVLGGWLAQLPSHHGAFAVEACTGWRFVVEELQAAGWQAYLAEPAETAVLRGPKRRAKTDRSDALNHPGFDGGLGGWVTRPPWADRGHCSTGPHAL
jgi:transposase